MPKANSLKLVPYADVGIWNRERGYYQKVRRLLEYTYGAPGEQSETGYGEGGSKIDWRPNEPFHATLRIDRLERGRSAARFWFVDDTLEIEYPFFGQGLVEMLSKANMQGGVVEGTWIAVKRGANYGIEML
jgi:hypothetical protein